MKTILSRNLVSGKPGANHLGGPPITPSSMKDERSNPQQRIKRPTSKNRPERTRSLLRWPTKASWVVAQSQIKKKEARPHPGPTLNAIKVAVKNPAARKSKPPSVKRPFDNPSPSPGFFIFDQPPHRRTARPSPTRPLSPGRGAKLSNFLP
jgi:hypothetical protein